MGLAHLMPRRSGFNDIISTLRRNEIGTCQLLKFVPVLRARTAQDSESTSHEQSINNDIDPGISCTTPSTNARQYASSFKRGAGSSSLRNRRLQRFTTSF